MTSNLRLHQLEGVRWLLAHPHGYLADAPRVGKTRTLLAAFKQSGSESGLIVVPAMVKSHWKREAEVLGIPDSHIDIVSYDRVARGDYDGSYSDILILDEAHFLKNPKAKRTKAILGKNGLARQILVVWPASGTPIPKNPSEIYPLLATLFPDVLRSRGYTTMQKFIDHFCSGYLQRVPFHNRPVFKITGGKNLEELKEMLAPIMLRRTLSDLHADVPTLDFQQLELTSSDPLAGYTSVDATPDNRALDSQARARRIVGELKAPMVADVVIDQIQDQKQRKIAVFAYHRSVLDILKARFIEAGLEVAYIDGDTTFRQRDIEQDQFQRGRPTIFLGQSKACEVGIRLDSADSAIIVEPSWTAMDNVQLANRIVDADRPGRHCVVQMVSLGGTIDDAVVAQNRRETEQAAQLFGV